MGQPLFSEQIESQGDASCVAYSARPLAQVRQVPIGIFVRSRIQNLGRKPEHSLGFVRFHQLFHDGLEIGQNFDLGQRLLFEWVQSSCGRGGDSGVRQFPDTLNYSSRGAGRSITPGGQSITQPSAALRAF